MGGKFEKVVINKKLHHITYLRDSKNKHHELNCRIKTHQNNKIGKIIYQIDINDAIKLKINEINKIEHDKMV
ncbi:hypothetical protein CAPN008_09310 [Capnocytophaga canis]|nr:hypothetical protein CAPN008_09310 [Capnocytophaga canis]